ncbi:MAG: PEGA domain-containing protein [Proteobacteria bacterium]|jgi:hypothetical protein|nr:PEGA domain-containing protein [Pseudomonadota bacterium]
MKTARAIGLALASLALVSFGCRDGAPTLVLKTAPPDATVVVDGYVHPGGTPHEIRFKAPGRYRLEVSRDGFTPIEMFVTLGSAERREQVVELIADDARVVDDRPLPPLDLPPSTAAFTVRITSSPSGAAVALRDPGSPTVRRAGVTPLAVDLPVIGATEVTLSLAGYSTHRRLVVPPAGGGEVQLDVVLARDGSGLKPPVFDDPLPPYALDPPDAKGYGYLSVQTNPWTAVYVDGKAIGNTPIADFRVATGSHGVLMENRDLGVRRKIEVFVRANEHVRLSENLK